MRDRKHFCSSMLNIHGLDILAAVVSRDDDDIRTFVLNDVKKVTGLDITNSTVLTRLTNPQVKQLKDYEVNNSDAIVEDLAISVKGSIDSNHQPKVDNISDETDSLEDEDVLALKDTTASSTSQVADITEDLDNTTVISDNDGSRDNLDEDIYNSEVDPHKEDIPSELEVEEEFTHLDDEARDESVAIVAPPPSTPKQEVTSEDEQKDNIKIATVSQGQVPHQPQDTDHTKTSSIHTGNTTIEHDTRSVMGTTYGHSNSAPIIDANSNGIPDDEEIKYIHGTDANTRRKFWLAAIVLVIGFLYVFCLSFIPVPASNRDFVNMALGGIIASVMGTVVGYVFGGKMNSEDYRSETKARGKDSSSRLPPNLSNMR